MKKKLYIKNTKDCIKQIQLVHGDKFGYEKVEFISNHKPISILCKECNSYFEITPYDILRGRGCKMCRYKRTAESNTIRQEEFERIANKIHNNRYIYEKYNGMRKYMYANCSEHGRFRLIPMNHIYKGYGCPKCGIEKCIISNTMTTNVFIERCKIVHNNRYSYDKTEYTGWNNKVKIYCPIHGYFEQLPQVHLLSKCGCPKCNQSHLEEEITNLLNDNNIFYVYQQKFEWLKYKKPQSIDFYLPDYNIAIECQGIQHFEERKFFNKGQINEIADRDKNKYIRCRDNGVKILYYTTDDIKKQFDNKISYMNLISDKYELLKLIYNNV